MKRIKIVEFNKNTFEEKVYKKKYFSYFINIIRINILDTRFSRIINFCSILIFVVIYYLYYLSLEKCFQGHSKCSKKVEWIEKKLKEGLSCSFLLIFLFELMIQKIISKLHLIHIIIVFSSFYKYSHGLEFYDHGFFNFLGVTVLLIIGNIFLLPLNLLFFIIKKKDKVILFIYLFVLIIFIYLYQYYLTNFLGCKDWSKGLNNTYINNNNKYECKIRIPKYCPYKFMKNFLDISKRTGIKCGFSSNSRNKIIQFSKSKYMNDKSIKIGFPKINKYPIWAKKAYETKSISSFISENLIDMENKSLLKKLRRNNLPEIVVDFSDNEEGKLNINLQFDENLSLQRKKKEEEYQPYSNNIMILYFDSVSRANGVRQLKKTLSFFEQFMPYNSKNFHSFQFFKYHSFKHYTPGNYPRLFFNNYRKKKKNLRITYYLKKYGFVTAFSNDMCFNHPYPTSIYKIRKEELCDHEFLICDPNKKHISSMTKRCLYEKMNIDYQYEYGLQFWRLYKDNRKFLMIVNNDGHEGTLEVIKYDDDIVFNFLNILYKDNLLKDTTILLLSDHGTPMPSIYYFSEFFKIEKQLPMLYIMTTNKSNQTYHQQYQNIYENQQKFITAYDIYNTLCYLILGKMYYKNIELKKDFISKSNLGINLFDRINKKRNPKQYNSMYRTICI